MSYLRIAALLMLSQTTFLSANYPAQQYQRGQQPEEEVKIYNENVTPNYTPPYGYYGYQPIPTPSEAFPDDAEAESLFENLSEE